MGIHTQSTYTFIWYKAHVQSSISVGWFSNNVDIFIDINFLKAGNLLSILASVGKLLHSCGPL